MRIRTLVLVGAVGLACAGASIWTASERSVASAAESWALRADVAESCSCDPACPCMFGSPMTNETCEGSRLYEIAKGHLGDVRLDGLKVIVAFRVGKWARYYVSEGATDEQLEAVAPLISRASPVFDVDVLGVERAPIRVERTEERVVFSGPASSVEIERMKGLHGRPIKMQDLPYPDLADYVQYESVENRYDAGGVSFEYSGTNGFTSVVDVRG